MQLKDSLQKALHQALAQLGVQDVDIAIQDVPADKPGDYGSPVAFGLAKILRKNPAMIAQDVLTQLKLPEGIARAEAVGPYINFFVDQSHFVKRVTHNTFQNPQLGQKVIVEHTSVNPNKEAHVGHLRNICLGDAIARILAAAGYTVEIQNYIDDTGRQAAESLFAVDYFKAQYDGEEKYDHWLGKLYVKLTEAKATNSERIEKGVTDVMHKLERGELRQDIAKIVHTQLKTYYRLGAEYDLLVWESDVVQSGFLEQGLAVLKQSDYVSTPSEGQYAGTMVMDVSQFQALSSRLEEPSVVLVRSDGNAVYVAKDIGYHYWKAGMFQGLTFSTFDQQPSGKTLYTSDPKGELHPDGHNFAHGDKLINVIDVRQEIPQLIVKTSLMLSDAGEMADKHHHLAYEVVTLEGQAMSGRKGITLAIDTVMDEAVGRAKAIILEKNPELEAIDAVAEQVGIGALRFSMLKSEAKRIIDFRWEQALNLQGDSAPYVQYAHARASKILRDAAMQGLSTEHADWTRIGDLEVKLAQVISRLPEVIQLAARDYAPHTLAQFALEAATAWNSYYNHKDAQGHSDTQVLKADAGLREARLALVAKVKETLAACLGLLGIQAPEEM